jgi:hypothetical protein
LLLETAPWVWWFQGYAGAYFAIFAAFCVLFRGLTAPEGMKTGFPQKTAKVTKKNR